MAITSSFTTNCATGTWKIDNPNPPPPQPTAPLRANTGTCSLHLNETKVCESDDKNLYGAIVVRDNVDRIIFEQSKNTLINLSSHWNIQLPLFASSLVVVGINANGGYVQFSYGSRMWKSNDTNQSGDGWCSLGGWNPRSGPVCIYQDIQLFEPSVS
jgi:hypothetical protein